MSCHAWRPCFCMVDGTLIPLASKPGLFGEQFFDCKSNYSLSLMVCAHFHAWITRTNTPPAHYPTKSSHYRLHMSLALLVAYMIQQCSRSLMLSRSLADSSVMVNGCGPIQPMHYCHGAWCHISNLNLLSPTIVSSTTICQWCIMSNCYLQIT